MRPRPTTTSQAAITITTRAWDLLGLCKFQLGDDAGAAEAFRAAEAAAPDVAAYGVRRRLAEARAHHG